MLMKLDIRHEVVPSPPIIIGILAVAEQIMDRKQKVKSEMRVFRDFIQNGRYFIVAIRPAT
jgi:hypothetical protein